MEIRPGDPKHGDFARGGETLPRDERLGSFAAGLETKPRDGLRATVDMAAGGGRGREWVRSTHQHLLSVTP